MNEQSELSLIPRKMILVQIEDFDDDDNNKEKRIIDIQCFDCVQLGLDLIDLEDILVDYVNHQEYMKDLSQISNQ